MNQKHLFASRQSVYRIEELFLAIIRQVPMIPAYQNVHARECRNGNVAGVVALLGGENPCFDVLVGQLLAFSARRQFDRNSLFISWSMRTASRESARAIS